MLIFTELRNSNLKDLSFCLRLQDLNSRYKQQGRWYLSTRLHGVIYQNTAISKCSFSLISIVYHSRNFFLFPLSFLPLIRVPLPPLSSHLSFISMFSWVPLTSEGTTSSKTCCTFLPVQHTEVNRSHLFTAVSARRASSVIVNSQWRLVM